MFVEWFTKDDRQRPSLQLIHNATMLFSASSAMNIFVSAHFLSSSGTILSIMLSIYLFIVVAISPIVINAFLARLDRKLSASFRSAKKSPLR